MVSRKNVHRPIAHYRKEYTLRGLTEQEVDSNPIRQFRIWFDQAVQAHVPEPTAMTLATATRKGKPSARMVLLKHFDEHGFVFFTNYASRKGRELAENPEAALVFHWVDLERQVRMVGSVKKVPRRESIEYFAMRPVGSQIGAVASRQSEVIPDRDFLERNAATLTRLFAGKKIPAPSTWGGYRLDPSEVEFWQGRQNRLHDRLLYTRQKNRLWKIERLSP